MESRPSREGAIPDFDAATLVSEALDRSGNIVVIAARDPDARLGLSITHVNDAFTVALGHPAHAAEGRPLDLILAPQSDEGTVASIRDSVERAHSLQIELLCCDHNGQSRWLGLHFMALGGIANGAPCYVIQGRDITEKRRERHESRSVQQLLASVFLFVDSPVSIVDENGAVRMANPSLADLIGLPVAELEGRPWTRFLDSREQDRVEEIRKRLALGEHSVSAAFRLNRADGALLPVRAHFAVVERPGLERFRVITFHRRPGGIRRGVARPRGQAPAASSADADLLLAGKISLVGMAEIRSSLGVRWPELAEQTLETAEAVLRRHLASDETYVRTDDQGFLVRLQEPTEEAAAFRAAMIGGEIRAAILGNGNDPAASAVTAITASIPRRIGEPEDPITLMDVLNRRLSEQRSRIVQRAQKLLREAMESTSSVLESVTGANRQSESPLAYVRLPAEVHRQIVIASGALAPATLERFDLDAFMLAVAAERIAEETLRRSRRICLVSVSFESLTHRRRSQRFLDICRNLDPPVQKRLAVMLNAVPRSVPESRLADVIQAISPFCRFVGLEIERPEPPAIDLAHLPLPIVSLPAASISAGADISRLTGFLRACHSHLLIRDIPNDEAAAAIARSGVGLFSWASSGEAVQVKA